MISAHHQQCILRFLEFLPFLEILSIYLIPMALIVSNIQYSIVQYRVRVGQGSIITTRKVGDGVIMLNHHHPCHAISMLSIKQAQIMLCVDDSVMISGSLKQSINPFFDCYCYCYSNVCLSYLYSTYSTAEVDLMTTLYYEQ